MGNCKSSSSRARVTAKLILLDGQLREFSWPVKVSFLLLDDSDTFICSAEGMEFEQLVSPMGRDEVLWTGELYFELPMAWRNHRMQAEDMAVLAFKASTALEESIHLQIRSCCCCTRKLVEPLILFTEKEKEGPLLAEDQDRVGVQPARPADGVKRQRLVVELKAIREE